MATPAIPGHAAVRTHQAAPPQEERSTFNTVAAVVTGVAGLVFTQYATDDTLDTRGQRMFFGTLLATATHQFLEQRTRIGNLTRQIGVLNDAPAQHAPPPAARVLDTRELDKFRTENRGLTRELADLKAQGNPELNMKTAQLLSAQDEIVRLTALVRDEPTKKLKLKQLEVEVAGKDARIARLSTQLDAAERELTALQSQPNQTRKVTELQAQLAAKETQIRDLNANLLLVREEAALVKSNLLHTQQLPSASDPASASAPAPRKAEPAKREVELICDAELGAKQSAALYPKELEKRNKELAHQVRDFDQQTYNLVLEHSGVIAAKEDELASKTRGFEATKAGLGAQIAELTKQIPELSTRHQAAQAALQQTLGLKITEAEKATHNLKLRTAQLTRQLEDAEARNAEADSAAHHDAQDATAALQTQLSAVQVELDTSKIDKEELEKQLHSLELELNLAQAGGVDIDTLNREHELTLAAITAEKGTLQSQVDDFEVTLAELREEELASRTAIANLEAEKETIIEAAAENDQIVAEIGPEFEALTAENKGLQEAYAALDGQLKKELTALDAANAQVTTLTAARESLRGQLTEKEATIQALVEAKDESADNFRRATADLQVSAARIAKLEDNYQKVSAEVAAYEETLAGDVNSPS